MRLDVRDPLGRSRLEAAAESRPSRTLAIVAGPRHPSDRRRCHYAQGRFGRFLGRVSIIVEGCQGAFTHYYQVKLLTTIYPHETTNSDCRALPNAATRAAQEDIHSNDSPSAD